MNPPSRYLLEALFLDSGAALSAWKRWRASADLDSLDSSSFLLLPTLAHQFATWLEQDPAQQILLGMCRRAWSQNQLHRRTMSEAAGVLRHSIPEPVIAAGPAVWSDAYWPGKSLRPIGAVDFVIAPESVTQALQAFLNANWSVPERGLWPSPERFRFGSPVPLKSQTGCGVRLHSRALPNTDLALHPQPLPPAVEYQSGETEIWTLPAEHALIAAITGHFEDGLDWRADGMMICRAASLNWQLVASLVQHRALGRSRLRELRREWMPEIPQEACKERLLHRGERMLASALRAYRLSRNNRRVSPSR